MLITDVAGAAQPVIMRGRHRLTSKFEVEITLSVERSIKVFDRAWFPQPSETKHWALAPKALKAMQPYFAKAAKMEGWIWGGEA